MSEQAPLTPSLIGSPSRWGLVEDYPYWRAVFRLYDQDKLEGAYRLASELGAGSKAAPLQWFRMLEAEYVTATESDVVKLSDELSFEFIPRETDERRETLERMIPQVVMSMKTRFKRVEQIPTWITILASEFEAPWTSHLMAYCSEKEPYFKICIQYSASLDDHTFRQTIAHEYAHVVSLSATKSRIPRWMGEAFSMYASDDFDARVHSRFSREPHLWLGPEELERRITARADGPDFHRWLAYQQSGFIFLYLSKEHGEEKLLALLDQFADEGILRNLRLLATGDRTDDAVRAVYGFGLDELFEKARLARYM